MENENNAEKNKLKPIREVDSVVIRFAGDSGDGMQLTGNQFTNVVALSGNDISTLPDYPAEIRAPAGTLAGVSGFQLQFADREIYTPGDEPEVLIAMNPAALKSSLEEIPKGASIIINTDEFTKSNLHKAGYDSNPLDDNTLSKYRVHKLPLTDMTRKALESFDELSSKEVDRCRNFMALGLVLWLYDRALDNTLEWIDKKFAKKPVIAEANKKVLQTGYHFGETAEAFQIRYRIKAAPLPPGTYRKLSGSEGVALGLVTAAQMLRKPLYYASYPITPASDILHNLAALKNYDVRTFQAEDEIAAMGSIIGAAYGGAIAATGTSGPGMALKSEGLNLAIALELPIVLVNVQRAGPSTGMPTKPEQADLLQALYGRNGESPIPIIAPASPADCFDIAIEAVKFAVRAMSPVIILSDGFLANSSEPWLIPDPDELPQLKVEHPQHADGEFNPYVRDPITFGRPWALPGTPGLEHRIGGLGKKPVTGNVSYDPVDNETMFRQRTEKVARLADVIPELEVFGPAHADLLVLGWGSTYGAIRQAVRRALDHGLKVAQAHLRYLNPMPSNIKEVLNNFEQVFIPEMNSGQLAMLLRARFLRDIITLNKIQGQPFKISEIERKIREILS